MEEFLPPDDYEGYVEVRNALSGEDCAVHAAEVLRGAEKHVFVQKAAVLQATAAVQLGLGLKAAFGK